MGEASQAGAGVSLLTLGKTGLKPGESSGLDQNLEARASLLPCQCEVNHPQSGAVCAAGVQGVPGIFSDLHTESVQGG